MRSAYCLGASGVLASAKNCAPLSAAASKASAGALELMELQSCASLPRTLADAAARGWQVAGADAEQGSQPLDSYTVQAPTVLVLGAPGGGARVRVHDVVARLLGGSGA